MDLVNNVSKIKPTKKSMTTVSIEDADESWALKLLNEFGIDDEHINVQAQEYLNHKNDKDNCMKSIYEHFETSHSDQKLVSSKSEDINEFDAAILSLSAIDNQKLELAGKKASLSSVKTKSKLNSKFFLLRIKALLSFDLLTLVR